MSLPNINFLHLTVSEIQPGQDFIGQGHYSKVKGQIKVRPWRCTTTHPSQCPYQVSTLYTLWFPRYSPNKIFKLKVTMARSKVRSWHCIHTPPNQCPYQVWTSYTLRFLRYSPDKLFPAGRPTGRPPIRTPWVKTIPQQPLRAVG